MKKKATCLIFFCIYLGALVYFLIFAEQMDRTLAERTYHYNLTLFKEINRFAGNVETLGLATVVLNLAGNVVGFMPMGVLLPAISERFRNIFLIALLSLDFSLAIELIQLTAKVGCFDVDDLLLNTLGGVCGYLVYSLFRVITRSK